MSGRQGHGHSRNRREQDPALEARGTEDEAAARPTHFLCMPLVGPALARSWAAFRADVTGGTGAVPGEVVRPLGTLHLMLGVISLQQRDGSLDRALQVLRGLRPRAELGALREAVSTEAASTAANSGGLRISLRGLRAMQSPAQASALYAAPGDAEDLLPRPFLDGGLMDGDGGRPLLLHATVVNTAHVGRSRRQRGRLTLDARELLGRYGDAFVWADDLPVTRLAICKMGAREVEGGDGHLAG